MRRGSGSEMEEAGIECGLSNSEIDIESSSQIYSKMPQMEVPCSKYYRLKNISLMYIELGAYIVRNKECLRDTKCAVNLQRMSC